MKKKGFTLVELLVVIAIIALLMGILMPALARVRQIAFRMVCGTNLSGIGKAMLIYSNDYDDELPRAGGRNSTWAALPANGWMAPTRFGAYNVSPTGEGGVGSISSCFYLLVKYAEVTPKSFICKGDSGTSEFKPAAHGAQALDLIDLWDFGPPGIPDESCSYSYHLPFGLYALTTSSEPGMAVAADRNPFITSPMAEAKPIAGFIWDGGREGVKGGNATQHQDDGQNVLFLDSHVGFMKEPYCGINDDNIYTAWDGGIIQRGAPPVGGTIPGDRTDSLLVQDGDMPGGGTTPVTPKGRACFVAETPALVDGKLVQIQKVTASEMTLQEHEGTYTCRDIVLETGNKISVVEGHCFMTESGQWVNAQNLTTSLRLKTLKGNVGIKSITTRSYTGKVYNLKIAGSDQYMVGKDSVIVRDF
ncbi:MAG: prepilin-type N-terminal cleavage/methylation domain-containing protein [Planctomycetota bacterium]|jgi:prepilin-type N-terminal cleavage/methylation domain-containing protein